MKIILNQIIHYLGTCFDLYEYDIPMTTPVKAEINPEKWDSIFQKQIIIKV